MTETDSSEAKMDRADVPVMDLLFGKAEHRTWPTNPNEKAKIFNDDMKLRYSPRHLLVVSHRMVGRGDVDRAVHAGIGRLAREWLALLRNVAAYVW